MEPVQAMILKKHAHQKPMKKLPLVTVEEIFRICNNNTASREASFS